MVYACLIDWIQLCLRPDVEPGQDSPHRYPGARPLALSFLKGH